MILVLTTKLRQAKTEQDPNELYQSRSRAYKVCFRTEKENHASNNGIERWNMAKHVHRHKLVFAQKRCRYGPDGRIVLLSNSRTQNDNSIDFFHCQTRNNHSRKIGCCAGYSSSAGRECTPTYGHHQHYQFFIKLQKILLQPGDVDAPRRHEACSASQVKRTTATSIVGTPQRSSVPYYTGAAE